MGDDIAPTVYTREQRHAYRAKVRRCLDVFERMLVEHSFDFDDGDFRRRETFAGFDGDFIQLVGVFNRSNQQARHAAAGEENQAQQRKEKRSHKKILRDFIAARNSP